MLTDKRRRLLEAALLSLGCLVLVRCSSQQPQSAGGLQPAERATRPNVLLVLADDLGDRLGSYGHAQPTPHLDRLARLGRRFDRAYCQHPASEPSSASLMSGRRPEDGGWGGLSESSGPGLPLASHFRAHGYFTGRVGAVDRGRSRRPEAWEMSIGGSEGDQDPGLVARAGQYAARLIAESGQRSFLVAVRLDASLTTGGAGGKAPSAELPRARPKDWQGVPRIAVEDLEFLSRPGAVSVPAAASEATLQEAAAAHAAHVAGVDAQVGLMLDALDRLGLWETTVVVVVGDSPPYLGEHGALARTDTLFEESLRAPLIIAAPGLARPGEASDGLVELVDLYPTLVELCGLPVPDGLAGISLEPLLDDPERVVRQAAVSVVQRRAGGIGRSVRSDRYRYNEWPDGSEELYDHVADPFEHTNLAGVPAQRGSLAEMRTLLDDRYKGRGGGRSGSATGPLRRPAGKPNVILIVLDDLTAHLGSYGYPVKTPHIDRLAAMGRRFDRAYAQVAMCAPSRTSFMVGWQPERVGVWNNVEPPRLKRAVPLQEHFRAHGYSTAVIGKVYEGLHAGGFRWDVAKNVPGPPRSPDDPRWWIVTDNADEDEPDGRRARLATELIAQRREQPLFMAVGLGKPHLRWVMPRTYFEMYDPDEMRPIESPPDDLEDIPAIAIKNRPESRARLFLAGREPPGLRPDPEWRCWETMAIISVSTAGCGGRTRYSRRPYACR